LNGEPPLYSRTKPPKSALSGDVPFFLVRIHAQFPKLRLQLPDLFERGSQCGFEVTDRPAFAGTEITDAFANTEIADLVRFEIGLVLVGGLLLALPRQLGRELLPQIIE